MRDADAGAVWGSLACAVLGRCGVLLEVPDRLEPKSMDVHSVKSSIQHSGLGSSGEHICIYMYIHVGMCMDRKPVWYSAHVNMYTYIYIYIYVCSSCVHIHTCIHTYIHTCRHMFGPPRKWFSAREFPLSSRPRKFAHDFAHASAS